MPRHPLPALFGALLLACATGPDAGEASSSVATGGEAAGAGADAPVPASERLAEAERALAAGDAAGAERLLRAALATPGLDAGAELAWRLRARLALLLAEDGRGTEARATAGLLCERLDLGMTPEFMPALSAALEARDVCGGAACARLAGCCRAFFAEISRATGAPMEGAEACASLVDFARSPEASDEICAQILSGWREGLANVPGAAIPSECR
ncbi:MAG: hypothetical protein KF729_16435 [Sandaracinaceae bacterium]|nr:hypothetical protein [Sandaracinaceae bacterium]